MTIRSRSSRSRWRSSTGPSPRAGCGRGLAGLAAAQQLARAGHAVTVFERDEAPGGLLRFGIPDFKIEKWLIDRRIEQLLAEGVRIEVGTAVGARVPAGD